VATAFVCLWCYDVYHDRHVFANIIILVSPPLTVKAIWTLTGRPGFFNLNQALLRARISVQYKRPTVTGQSLLQLKALVSACVSSHGPASEKHCVQETASLALEDGCSRPILQGLMVSDNFLPVDSRHD
jgi:hypothetical protein